VNAETTNNGIVGKVHQYIKSGDKFISMKKEASAVSVFDIIYAGIVDKDADILLSNLFGLNTIILNLIKKYIPF